MAKMSPEQKLAAVQRYINGKESSRTVAADFGISHRYLRVSPDLCGFTTLTFPNSGLGMLRNSNFELKKDFLFSSRIVKEYYSLGDDCNVWD
ncbi:MAG: transposase [Kurthia sp.]|nr:transposase [Candidatus Kurthia equi]